MGVDVERVGELAQLDRIVERRFAPTEAAAILAREGEDRLRAFYRAWTVKEACLKATGAGIWEGIEDVVANLDVGPGRPPRGPAMRSDGRLPR